MPITYVTVDALRSTARLNLTSTALDSQLIVLLEAVSEGVNQFSKRRFDWIIEDRDFDGPGGTRLEVPDLIAIPGSGVKEDTNEDGTFETVWANAGTDYHYWPYNAAPTSTWGRPYNALLVNKNSNGTQDEWLKGQRNYRITGTWGYNKVTRDSGRNGTLADGTTTSLVLDGSAGDTFERGHLLLIDDELLYVSTAVGTGTALTVVRAVNGSTGTAHTNKDVNIVQFPGPVMEAVHIQTARLWKRKDSAFANEIGFPETGQLVVFKGLDPDVQLLLTSGGYKRMVV